MPVAQVALHFGANDVQGTVVREEIFRAAGSTTGTEQKLDELARVVRAAGRIPVQRDTFYNELRAVGRVSRAPRAPRGPGRVPCGRLWTTAHRHVTFSR